MVPAPVPVLPGAWLPPAPAARPPVLAAAARSSCKHLSLSLPIMFSHLLMPPTALSPSIGGRLYGGTLGDWDGVAAGVCEGVAAGDCEGVAAGDCEGVTAGVSEGVTLGVVCPGWVVCAITALANARAAAVLSSLNMMRGSFA